MKFAQTLLSAGILASMVSASSAQEPIQNPDFALVQKHLDTGGVRYSYVDTDGFFRDMVANVDIYAASVIEITPEEVRGEARQGIAEFQRYFKVIYPELGLESIEGVGSSTIRDGADGLFINRAFLHLAEERKGLAGLLTAAPRERGTLHFAPETTVIYGSTDAKPTNFIALAESVAEKVQGPGGGGLVRMGLGMMDMQTKMQLTKMVESIDGEVCFALSSDRSRMVALQAGEPGDEATSIPRPDLFFAVQSSDSLIRDEIVFRLQREGFVVDEIERDGLKMSVIKMEEYYEGFAPTLAHDGKYVYFATSPDELAMAIARLNSGEGGVAGNAEFISMMEGAPTANNSLFFVSREAVQLLVESTASNLPAGGDRAKHEEIATAVFSAYGIYPRLSTRRTVPDGIEFYTRGTYDGRMAVAYSAAVVPTVLAAIAVPSFLRAREISRRNACQENLSRIDGAKQQWALETNAPATATPQWTDLVGENLFLRSSPVCPSGGRYTIGTLADDPSCSLTVGTGEFPHLFPGN